MLNYRILLDRSYVFQIKFMKFPGIPIEYLDYNSLFNLMKKEKISN